MGHNRRVPAKPLSVDYWDDWYAGKAATPTVGEVMNRHLGLPPDLLAGVVPADAIPELTTELRLKPGDTLLDLACGRAGYGLTVARGSGARLVGIDVSAEALVQAREQAARLGVADAWFRVGRLTASGLPDASADAVLCTDAIQFSDDPSAAYREIRRVAKAGGRVALTCWEPVDRDDERLSARLRRVDLAAGLAEAGLTGIEVRERPAWQERERAIWEEAVTIDPGDDPALASFHGEGVRSLEHFALIRRVLAVATAP
jgi:SAM-dependent methyltransferase